MFAIPEQRDPIPKTGKFLTLALAGAVTYGAIFAISQIGTEKREKCETVIEWGDKPIGECASMKGEIRCYTADYTPCTEEVWDHNSLHCGMMGSGLVCGNTGSYEPSYPDVCSNLFTKVWDSPCPFVSHLPYISVTTSYEEGSWCSGAYEAEICVTAKVETTPYMAFGSAAGYISILFSGLLGVYKAAAYVHERNYAQVAIVDGKESEMAEAGSFKAKATPPITPGKGFEDEVEEETEMRPPRGEVESPTRTSLSTA